MKLNGRYTLVLNSFGLRHIKPYFYSSGSALQSSDRGISSMPGNETQKYDTLPGDMVKMSYMGTQVFSDLVLMNADASIRLELDTALIEVTCKKRIVKTSITGRDGSVKEYINNEDCQIRIRALIISPQPDQVPVDALLTLERLRKINDNLLVISPYLNDVYDINNIVVDDIRTRQEEGKLNIISLDISAYEDKELSIIVNDETNQ